ncbi:MULTISPECIES: acyltransferase [unclassified Oleiphilus]|uniref:acyltransferase family protein n=1 Tax=unclassified Oleiphilus TaxID=2631174 RepID=UPI0007C25B21|nr:MULTISPECIES: acyltransferase [unclassified Oleiphilus]KZY35187.1 hypothetical protein A3729_04695 [Oleiphilus sp. HI0043]KZZ62400.1 hypothetical protein A3763_08080 [Oleiphilus sp. HI0128]
MNVLYSIQVLRGLACLAVVFSHALAKAKNYPSLELPSVFVTNYSSIVLGHAGVDLFFVLSGFIIFWVHHKDFGDRNRIPKFILSRLIRVVPIYWILTLVGVVTLLLFPHLFIHRSEVEIPWVLGSLFFIPVPTSYGVVSPVLGVGWTLNYEMYFYLMFALLLFFRKEALYVLLLLYSVLILLFSDPTMRTTLSYSDLVLSPMVVEFSFGVFAAWLYMNLQLKLIQYRYLFLMASLSLYIYSFLDVPVTYFNRTLLWGGGGFFIVLFALSIDWKPKNLLGLVSVRLGDVSYSAYLLQVFTLPFFTKVFFFVGLENIFGFWVFSIAITILTVFASYIFWLLLEEPITRSLKKRFISSQKTLLSKTKST